MSSCYEFVLACQINENISEEVLDTLKYMTSSGIDEFEPTIEHPLFTEGNVWRTIISKGDREGEQYISGVFGVIFENYNLSIRRLLHEDEFLNDWIFLGDWLASISSTYGFVGYYKRDNNLHPTLIYFNQGNVLELAVEGDPELMTLEQDEEEQSLIILPYK